MFDSVICTIHTMNFVIFDNIECRNKDGIKFSQRINHNTGNSTIFVILNPEQYCGEECDSLEKTINLYQYVLKEFHIDEMKLHRIDLKIDFCEEDSYIRNFKLNKLICLLYSHLHNLRNRYQSHDPLLLMSHNIVAKNDYFEIEYYNKKLQSNGSSPVDARLEFRKKRLKRKNLQFEDIVRQTCNNLINDLILLPNYYKNFQSSCNEVLIKKFFEENSPHHPFVKTYENNFFSIFQIIEFYRAIGLTNPKDSAYYFSKVHNFENITSNILRNYSGCLIKSINKFLESSLTMDNSNTSMKDGSIGQSNNGNDDYLAS
ncbi:MAG: hypothetical protein GX933_06200 [Chloroflexi bacterium]|nr:hypothetical protein [Chloroflexota bacterium]